MKTALIVAKGTNNVIGKDNALMWHLPRDMQFFKETTMGAVVVMGRKNYESIPQKFRPFKGRLNVVVSRSKNYRVPNGTLLFDRLENALTALKKNTYEKCFIIGGGEIYAEALRLNLVDELYITEVNFDEVGTVYFPTVDLTAWQKELLFHQPKDATHAFDFSVYKYTR